ncbi:MAG: OmpH family outer membrane protein [Bacteroidota bacterium]
MLALLVGASALQAQAQSKYGHMNLGNLLALMPETQKANDDLKVYTDKLGMQDDSLTKAFQAAYSQLETEYNGGLLTPVVAQQRQAELQKQQEFIQKFEQEAQQMVAAKREELLKPILTKITDAVKAVAVENKYMMIFDTSSGIMLYADDTEDVTAIVKKKLGI